VICMMGLVEARWGCMWYIEVQCGISQQNDC
jgi:hypothetical protein